MATPFELFFNYFLNTRPYATLREAFDAYDLVTTFEAFKDSPRNTLSAEVCAELDAYRKIGAIKQHRKEAMDDGRPYSLKESKDIIDAAIAANPAEWDIAQKPQSVYKSAKESALWVTGDYNDNDDWTPGHWTNADGIRYAEWEVELFGLND